MNANGRPGHRLFHSVQYTRTAASHAYFSCRVRTGTYIALEYAVPLASAPDSCHHVNVLPLVCSATNNRRCHNWRRTSRWAATPVKRPDANHTPRCELESCSLWQMIRNHRSLRHPLVELHRIAHMQQSLTCRLPGLVSDDSSPEILSGESDNDNSLRAAKECSIVGCARALGASCAGALPVKMSGRN